MTTIAAGGAEQIQQKRRRRWKARVAVLCAAKFWTSGAMETAIYRRAGHLGVLVKLRHGPWQGG